MHATCDDDGHVGRLTGFGTNERLDVLAPAPARLEYRACEHDATEGDLFDLTVHQGVFRVRGVEIVCQQHVALRLY